MLILSLAGFLGAYYINSSLGTVILSACLGYILSTDLGGLGSQLLTLCSNRNKVSSSMTELRPEDRKKRSFLWRWGILEFLYHFVMLAIVGVISGMYTVSHFSYASLFQGPHFLTKMLEYNILYDNLLIDILSV